MPFVFQQQKIWSCVFQIGLKPFCNNTSWNVEHLTQQLRAGGARRWFIMHRAGMRSAQTALVPLRRRRRGINCHCRRDRFPALPNVGWEILRITSVRSLPGELLPASWGTFRWDYLLLILIERENALGGIPVAASFMAVMESWPNQI